MIVFANLEAIPAVSNNSSLLDFVNFERTNRGAVTLFANPNFSQTYESREVPLIFHELIQFRHAPLRTSTVHSSE